MEMAIAREARGKRIKPEQIAFVPANAELIQRLKDVKRRSKKVVAKEDEKLKRLALAFSVSEAGAQTLYNLITSHEDIGMIFASTASLLGLEIRGEPIPIWVAMSSFESVLEMLVKQARKNPDMFLCVDNDGTTPLHILASRAPNRIKLMIIDIAAKQPDLLHAMNANKQTPAGILLESKDLIILNKLNRLGIKEVAKKISK